MSNICDEFRRDKSRNPRSNRKISPTGNVYKQLMKECRENADRDDVCRKFAADPSRNPRSNRKIKCSGPTYLDLLLECNGVRPTKATKKKRHEQCERKYQEEEKDDRSCIGRSLLPLKKHQEIVVNQLMSPDRRGLIAVHAVGSGKTLTAVTASACFLDSHPQGTVVVITPTSLQNNFKKEMEAYGPLPNDKFRFYTTSSFYNASKRKEVSCRNAFLIIDEAHNLRNPTGVRLQHVVNCASRATKVLLLTATPVVNYPEDLLSLTAIVDGDSPPSKDGAKAIISSDVNSRVFKNYFGNKISFFAPDIAEIKNFYPESIVEDVYIPMTSSYEKKYKLVETEEFDKLGAQFRGDLKVFYNGVRRAVNYIDDSEPSPKVKWVENMLKKHKGKRFVIFSHWLEAGMKQVEKVLRKLSIGYGVVNGTMSMKKRLVAVTDYNSGKKPVLLISKAGGEGLDLKGTFAIIIMDPSWNQATLDQVIGRAIRYKSHLHLPKADQKVHVYSLYLILASEKKKLKEILRDGLDNVDEKKEEEQDMNELARMMKELNRDIQKEPNMNKRRSMVKQLDRYYDMYKQLKHPKKKEGRILTVDLYLKLFIAAKEATNERFLREVRKLSL